MQRASGRGLGRGHTGNTRRCCTSSASILAWAEKAKPNESGIVMLDQAGTIVSAGWAVGIHEVVAWLDRHAPSDALLFVDAPLVVNNAKGAAPGARRR